MKNILLTLSLSCILSSALSQKYDYNWIDGSIQIINNTSNFTVSFNQYPPLIQNIPTDYSLNNLRNCLSDINGNLLFAATGCYLLPVQNNYPEIPMNGIDAFCNQFNNEMIIPGGIWGLPAFIPNHYYLFSFAMSEFPPNTAQCLVDKFLFHTVYADPDTSYLVKTDSILASGCFQMAAANRHANGRDWWIILPDNKEPRFFKWLYSPEGISGPDTQYIANNPAINLTFFDGWYQFSPDGTKYLCRYRSNKLILYDFDRCTGEITGPILHMQKSYLSGAVGGAFSPDNRYLYLSDSIQLYLHQYDLTAPDIEASEQRIGVWDGYFDEQNNATPFGWIQNGPDGKLYIWAGSKFMHVIDFPNRPGTACGLRQRGIALPQRTFGANNYYPHYRLGPVDGSACDSLGIDNIPMAMFHYDIEDTLLPLQITFTDASYYQPSQWFWSFGDGTFSQDTNAVHLFPGPGQYEVCLIVSNNYGSDTLCRTVTVTDVSGAYAPVQAQARVWPNPCNEFLQVDLPALSGPTLECRMYDLFGRQVLRQPLLDFSNRINTHSLPAGMYHWSIFSKGAPVQSGKVVRVR